MESEPACLGHLSRPWAVGLGVGTVGVYKEKGGTGREGALGPAEQGQGHRKGKTCDLCLGCPLSLCPKRLQGVLHKISATEVSFIRTGEVMHRQRQLRKAQYIQKVYLVPQQVTPFSSQVLVPWSTPV